METTIVACILTGLTCLFLGYSFGVVSAIAGRLFFQHNFVQFCRENMMQAEENLNRQILAVQNQANTMVATAHAQAADIYKRAADAVVKDKKSFGEIN